LTDPQKKATEARFPFKRNRLRCVRCVNENRKKRKRLPQPIMVATASTEHSYWLALAFVISRNKRKRQPIGMLGRSSGNHDWLLANASDCV